MNSPRSTSLEQANQAFDSGQTSRGLQLLREHNRSASANAESWHRQAVVEEQVGDWQTAGFAHLQSIKLAPNIALGYLYAGNWLQTTGNINAAAAAYSVVLDIDSELLNLASGPLAERSQKANKVLRSHLSKMHRQHCERLQNTERVANAIWPRTHDRPITNFSDDALRRNYSPQLFYLPELRKQAFYATAEFAWSTKLLAQQPVIQKELEAYLSEQASADELRPYLDANHRGLGNLQELAGSQNWSALDLFRGGKLNSGITKHFPATLEVLNTIPTYKLGEHPFEVFFSILRAGQSIAPHFGESNHALTTHLPLVIPGNGWLQVNGEKREWKTEELLTFDDSFLHSAHNQSNTDRIVLIFSIWHPDLSQPERAAIQSSFKLREEWYAQRGVLLEHALMSRDS